MFKDKWFVFVIVLSILVFFWFGLRPAYTRSYCQDKARDAGAEWWNFEFTRTLDNLKKSQLQTEYMAEFYNRCLHDKGLSE